MEPVQDTTAAAAPGIYNVAGTPSGLAFWTGSLWDPRPVASVWSRLWALAIDLLFTFILAAPLLLLLELVSPSSPGSSSTAISLPSLLLTQVIYFTVCYSAFGHTVGMLAARIDVVSISTQGSKLSLSASLLRSLVLCVSLVVPFLALVWLIWTSSSSTRRGPQDLASGSAVLRATKGQRVSDPQAGAGQVRRSAPFAGKRVAMIALLAVTFLAIIAGAVYADSRLKTAEMEQLLTKTEASEAIVRSFLSRLDDLQSEYEPRTTLCGQNSACWNEVFADWRAAQKSTAREHLIQLQEAALDVEAISTLPWHGDLGSARDAYLEHMDAWLERIDYESTYEIDNYSESTYDSLSNEIARTWVVAERRFRDIAIWLTPDDIPGRVDSIFRD